MSTNDIVMIPLNKLVPGKRNVRKTKPDMSIEELAASIKAHGLLQNLIVNTGENDTYPVDAGGRRFKALRLLVRSKDMAPDALIPCKVVPEKAAHEASLAENVQRINMHPADELAAFLERIKLGDSPDQIAQRFGYTLQHVARRLKLARVSPKLLKLLRQDEIGLDQIAALAISDDHAAQEAAYFGAPDWARSPERLRALLTQDHFPETDKLVRFVGVDAYQAEGGRFASDLLIGEDACLLGDGDLLVKLAQARLEPIADEVRGEGWAWVEITLDGVAWANFPERVREARRKLSRKEQARKKELYAELDQAKGKAKIAKIEAEIDALAPTAWPEEEIGFAGAIVTLTHDGELKIERGLVKSEDVKGLKALRRKKAAGDSNGGSAPAEASASVAPRGTIAAKLRDELMAHKTLALRAELPLRPDAALRILVFTLAEGFVGGFHASPLDLRIKEEDVSRSINHSDSKAPAAYAKIAAYWRKRVPADRQDLWRFITESEQQTLLELLAVMIAPGFDLRNDARASGHDAEQSIGDLIAEAVGLDMSRWWTASPDSYFNHVKRDVIVDAIRELNPALDRSKLEKAPKAELVARAKRMFKGANWLPESLRAQSASVQPPAEAIAAE